jgi:hypothetical protein
VWPTSGPRVANRMEHELTRFGHAIDRCIAIRAKHLSECEHRLRSPTRRGKRHRPKLMLGIELIDSLVSGVIRGMTDTELGRSAVGCGWAKTGFPIGEGSVLSVGATGAAGVERGLLWPGGRAINAPLFWLYG